MRRERRRGRVRTRKVFAEDFNGGVSLDVANHLVALLEVVRLESLPRQAAISDDTSRSTRQCQKMDVGMWWD